MRAAQQGPREEQQDCGAALLWLPRGILSPHCAAVVADGMGGMADGGWASRRAVEIVVERCLAGDHDTPRDMLADALFRAQHEVLAGPRRAARRSVAAIWDRLAGETLTDNATVVAIEPGRALRHAEERFMEKELRFGDVVLVAPTGVLRENLRT